MDSKFFLQSKTILGALTAFLVTFLPVVGVTFSADDAAFINQAWDALIVAASSLFAVYGRFKADRKVHITQ